MDSYLNTKEKEKLKTFILRLIIGIYRISKEITWNLQTDLAGNTSVKGSPEVASEKYTIQSRKEIVYFVGMSMECGWYVYQLNKR